MSGARDVLALSRAAAGLLFKPIIDTIQASAPANGATVQMTGDYLRVVPGAAIAGCTIALPTDLTVGRRRIVVIVGVVSRLTWTVPATTALLTPAPIACDGYLAITFELTADLKWNVIANGGVFAPANGGGARAVIPASNIVSVAAGDDQIFVSISAATALLTIGLPAAGTVADGHTFSLIIPQAIGTLGINAVISGFPTKTNGYFACVLRWDGVAAVWRMIGAPGLYQLINGGGVTYIRPTTGQTVAIAASTDTELIDPAAAIAALTITFPAAPVDNQRFSVAITQAITALTWPAAAHGVPTSTSGYYATTFVWSAANALWSALSSPSAAGGGGIPDAPSDGTLYGRKNAAWSAVTAGVIPDASTATLGAWSQNIDAYLSAKTLNGNGCVSAATVTWPDGKVGTYALTTADAIRLDTPNAFVATYVGTSSTRTITQSAVTRNANTGLVTTRPAPTVV